jgi:hypothetical protein
VFRILYVSLQGPHRTSLESTDIATRPLPAVIEPLIPLFPSIVEPLQSAAIRAEVVDSRSLVTSFNANTTALGYIGEFAHAGPHAMVPSDHICTRIWVEVVSIGGGLGGRGRIWERRPMEWSLILCGHGSSKTARFHLQFGR